MIESLTKIQMLAPVQYLLLVFTSGFIKKTKVKIVTPFRLVQVYMLHCAILSQQRHVGHSTAGGTYLTPLWLPGWSQVSEYLCKQESSLVSPWGRMQISLHMMT